MEDAEGIDDGEIEQEDTKKHRAAVAVGGGKMAEEAEAGDWRLGGGGGIGVAVGPTDEEEEEEGSCCVVVEGGCNSRHQQQQEEEEVMERGTSDLAAVAGCGKNPWRRRRLRRGWRWWR